ncbi:MAG TPA: hypothetical protein VMQ65_02000 [Candidatus Limnocylindria bacterium]|nr:hypothetical protein [Candidatus Limnocylindria bacterium]
MVDPGAGPNEAALAVAARHALHDEEQVAALATGNLEDEGDVARARQLVDRCAACRELHQDLEAIGGALRAGARFTATAPRDFRLTADDARRLGGTVSTRGFLARLRGSLVGIARPLGASMTALGLVGLLVGSASLGGAASAPLSVDSTVNGSPAAPGENNAGTRSVSPLSSDRSVALGPGATPEEGAAKAGDPSESDGDPGRSPAALLLGGSLGLLAAGLILLGLAFRRGRRDRAPA